MKLIGLFLIGSLATVAVAQDFACDITSAYMSNYYRDMYLTYHNERRALLEAGQQELADGSYNIPAEEIPPLTWNCELEALAQTSAEQYCTTGNASLNLIANESYNAENWDSVDKGFGYYVSCGPLMWWSEVKWVGMTHLNNNPNYTYLYAQKFARMAWAKTTQVGCSFTQCNGQITRAICIYREDSIVPYENIYEPKRDPTTLGPTEPQDETTTLSPTESVTTTEPDPTKSVTITDPTPTESEEITSTNSCPPFSTIPTTTEEWDSTTITSTPFTTVIVRTSTIEYATETSAFPTSSLATMTPTTPGYEEPETTPRGCPTEDVTTRATRIFTDPTAITTLGTPSPATQCNSADTGSTLTPAQRQVFVDKHNAYRSELANGNSELPDGSYASPASNMYKMSYSCELEKVAQEWADRCVWEHSPYEHRNGGENLYMLTTGLNGDYADRAVSDSNDLWWLELKRYGGITRTNVTLTREAFDMGIGHWSQMAWAKTLTIGCGYTACPRENTVMHFVVCNYRPTGNYINQEIYQIGHPCIRDSDCTREPNSRCEVSTGLCYV